MYDKYDEIQVVPARGGAEVALGIHYKTFLIYRTFMHRAPARPMRACFVRSCCAAVQEHDLSTTPAQCNAKQTLSSHFALHSSHPALHTSHLHFTLHTSSHLISSHLIWAHLIWALLISFHVFSICTTLCYKACTKHSPVLLCTAQLQKTSKDNSITHAAVAPSNLDAAITMRYRDIE